MPIDRLDVIRFQVHHLDIFPYIISIKLPPRPSLLNNANNNKHYCLFDNFGKISTGD